METRPLSPSHRTDSYEIAIFLASCFLVNYISVDSRTNWTEGYMIHHDHALHPYLSTLLRLLQSPHHKPSACGQAAITALISVSVYPTRSRRGEALGEAAVVVEAIAGEVMQDLRGRVVFGD